MSGRLPKDNAALKMETSKPKMPSGLDAVAKKCWATTVAALEKLSLLANCDAIAIERYCRYYSRFVSASKTIAEDGATMNTPSGIKAHPACYEANNAATAMRTFEMDFGLTPTSRAKLRVEGSGKEDNPFAKFTA